MPDLWVRQPEGTWKERDNIHTPPQWTAYGQPPPGTLMFGSAAIGYSQQGIADLIQPDQLNADLGVWRMYYGGADSATAVRNDIIAAHNNRGIPCVSFKLPVTWAQAAAGSADSWAQSLATMMANVTTGPIWLCFHHEPEGDGVAADFRAMVTRLMGFFTAPHIMKWVIVAGYQAVSGGAWSWDSAYPGDGVIHGYGIDWYNLYQSSLGSTWQEFTDPGYSLYDYEKIDTWVRSKPNGGPDGQQLVWGHFETGWTDLAFTPGPNGNDTVPQGSTRDWLQRVYDGAREDYPLCKAIVYWPYQYGVNSWHWLDNEPKRLKIAAVAQQAASLGGLWSGFGE